MARMYEVSDPLGQEATTDPMHLQALNEFTDFTPDELDSISDLHVGQKFAYESDACIVERVA